MFEEKQCGCTGIRHCLLCHHTNKDKFERLDSVNNSYWFCPNCQQIYKGDISWWVLTDDKTISCKNHENVKCTDLVVQGVEVYQDFITYDEKVFILNSINKEEWKISQSGRRKQDFGPKANFKRRKLKLGSFTGLPSYSKFLVDRLKSFETLKNFLPVELCNLEYTRERGSSIDPHVDDMWLWGDALVTVNVQGKTIITLSKSLNQTNHSKQRTNDTGQSVSFENNPQVLLDENDDENHVPRNDFKARNINEENSIYSDIEILIPAPPQSVYILSNEARTIWLHAIKPQHIESKRVAMTFRNLSKEFETESQYADVRHDVLELARSFNGTVVK